MNKKFLGVALALGTAAVATPSVFATNNTNITTAEALKNCLVQAENATCKLGADIEVAERYILTSDINLDLNGHKITNVATAGANTGIQVSGHTFNITSTNGEGDITIPNTINAGVIRVYGTDTKNAEKKTVLNIGKNVTIMGGNGINIYDKTVDGKKSAYNVEVNIEGHVQGTNSGIWAMGNFKETDNYPTINIKDGAVIYGMDDKGEKEEPSSVGIAAMGYAKWNIGRAEIKGDSAGIGVKAGIMNIGHANIEGLKNYELGTSDPELYGNGINPSGAAIQIESNAGYAGSIELTLDGPTLMSNYSSAIYEYGTAGRDVKIKINEASLTSRSGVTTYLVTSNVKRSIPDGRVVSYLYSQDYDTIVITPVADIEGVEEGKYVAIEEFSHLNLNEQEKLDEALKNLGIKDTFRGVSIYDITVKEKSTDSETEHSTPLTFSIKLNEEELNPAEGFIRTWHIFHIHGDNIEEIDSKIIDGELVFQTSEYSTYVLGYSDEKAPEAPKTGIFTNDSTVSKSANLIAAILTGITTTLGSLFIMKKAIKRHQK